MVFSMTLVYYTYIYLGVLAALRASTDSWRKPA